MLQLPFFLHRNERLFNLVHIYNKIKLYVPLQKKFENYNSGLENNFRRLLEWWVVWLNLLRLPFLAWDIISLIVFKFFLPRFSQLYYYNSLLIWYTWRKKDVSTGSIFKIEWVSLVIFWYTTLGGNSYIGGLKWSHVLSKRVFQFLWTFVFSIYF